MKENWDDSSDDDDDVVIKPAAAAAPIIVAAETVAAAPNKTLKKKKRPLPVLVAVPEGSDSEIEDPMEQYDLEKIDKQFGNHMTLR
jgi:hypothetical protein